MTLARRRRNATAVLLDELDRLARDGNRHAANMAGEIRDKGDAALARLLTVVAGHVVEAQIWATVDPICKAFCAYELAVTGIDWRKAPSEQVRARTFGSVVAAMPQRARDRQDAAISRAHERMAGQRLTALRAAASGRRVTGPGVVLLAPGPRIPESVEESTSSRRTAPAQRTGAATYRGPETRRT